ncbi:MAG: ABC transporter substrate-binding protein [Candidatus Rokuibacteriota bacterium]|jgi:NitT/TauT family transport system substrate-binding protein|nr:MAG: ABC transporter substrate-binding protein [Candidatus Rokubacteria bacterium]
MPSISRRRFLVSTSGLLVAGALAPAVVRAQTSVKIGTAVLGDYSLAGPFIVAVERGFFRAENVDVEFVPFRGGPNLVKAVISGEVLLGAAGSTDILVFREAGMPLKMVATHTEGNHFTLNVAPEVQGAGDLKGKSIGVTSVGATTWVFARMVAKQQGWDPDRDVKIVGLGGLDAQLAALARKEIHAFVWGDGGAVTQLAGKSKVLMRLDKVTARWISQIQYVSEEGIRKQDDDIRKVMKGLFAAIRYMTEQTAEAAGIISKKIGWSPEAVLAAHKISGGLMSHDGTVSLEALRSMQDTLLEHGVIKKRLPLEEHVARGFTPVKLG